MSLRLKPHMGELLETLASAKSLDKTTVMMLALQLMAKAEGIPIPIEEKEQAAA